MVLMRLGLKCIVVYGSVYEVYMYVLVSMSMMKRGQSYTLSTGGYMLYHMIRLNTHAYLASVDIQVKGISIIMVF